MKTYTFTGNIIDEAFSACNISKNAYSDIISKNWTTKIDVLIDDENAPNKIHLCPSDGNVFVINNCDAAEVRRRLRNIAKLYIVARVIINMPFNTYIRLLDEKDPIIWIYKSNAIKSEHVIVGGENNINVAINDINDMDNIVKRLISYSDCYPFPNIHKMIMQIPNSIIQNMPVEIFKYPYVVPFSDKDFSSTIVPQPPI